jgi:hypothetical protein
MHERCVSRLILSPLAVENEDVLLLRQSRRRLPPIRKKISGAPLTNGQRVDTMWASLVVKTIAMRDNLDRYQPSLIFSGITRACPLENLFRRQAFFVAVR